MTLLSALTIAPGLKGADAQDTANCLKEKTINNAKSAVPAVMIGGLSGAAIALAEKNNKVADSFEKTFDGIAKFGNKASKKVFGSDLKEITKKATDYFKANPKVAKTVAIVGTIALGATKLLTVKNIHENGKIEGKYQTITNAKNSK